jgi:hypothetical protein
MNGFWNDNDKVTVKDFEKLVCGLCFALSVIVILVLACFHFVDGTLCTYSLGLGGLFVLRKIFKYDLEKKTLGSPIETTEDEEETSTPQAGQ